MTLTDDPANPNDPLVRVDKFIDFNFDAMPGASPDPRIGADTFSIRWEGVFTPRESGDYIFHGISDDGIRVFLDGTPIVDAWVDRGRTDTPSDPITLEAGTDHTIVVEYYENGGGANVTVDYEVNGNRRVIGPDELSRKALATVPLSAPWARAVSTSRSRRVRRSSRGSGSAGAAAAAWLISCRATPGEKTGSPSAAQRTAARSRNGPASLRR